MLPRFGCVELLRGVVELWYVEEESMGMVLEVEVPQRAFKRRVQPFGIALADVSWRVKMFTHEGVVLSALYLEEPDIILALSFWPDTDEARRLFKGSFEICLCSSADPSGRVRLSVQLDPTMVEELFVAAELVKPNPLRAHAKRAEKYFVDFLNMAFPDSIVVWARSYCWQDAPQYGESAVPIRVG